MTLVDRPRDFTKENDNLLGFKCIYPSVYELETPDGYVTVAHKADGGDFRLGNIYVEPNSRGDKVGKWFAEQAKALARNLGATTISATAISREGYETLRSAFGPEYLEVETLGDFGQPDYKPETPTKASLVYPLQEFPE